MPGPLTHLTPQRRSARVPVLAVCAALLLGCPADPYPEVKVDLAGSRPAPTARRPRDAVLRFSVAAMQSPQDTFAAYSRLFELLEGRLDASIELVQRRTYQEVNTLLTTGQLDAALVCTGGYLELERRSPGAVEVVAMPVVHGQTTYRSYLIVPTGSPARELADLRGRRFAFTDDLSLSGYLYPTHLVRTLGAEPMSFFGSTTFTHSHDRSVEAVAKGLVDGAAVDSLVYDALVRTSKEVAAGTRVIHRSPPYGTAPVVVSTRLPPARRAAIREAFLRLHEAADAREALGRVGFDRFTPPEPALYAGAAAILGAAR